MNQNNKLFNAEIGSNDPESHWIGMPEFVNEKQEPYAKIVVRFETQADLDEFAKLIGQKLTNKTKSIWHPFKSHFGANRVRYEYDSNET